MIISILFIDLVALMYQQLLLGESHGENSLFSSVLPIKINVLGLKKIHRDCVLHPPPHPRH